MSAKSTAAAKLHATLSPLLAAVEKLGAEYAVHDEIDDWYDDDGRNHLEIHAIGKRARGILRESIEAFDNPTVAYFADLGDELRAFRRGCKFDSDTLVWIPDFLRDLRRRLLVICETCALDLAAAPDVLKPGDPKQRIGTSTTLPVPASVHRKRKTRGAKRKDAHRAKKHAILARFPDWREKTDEPSLDEFQEALDEALSENWETDDKQYFMPPHPHQTWLQYRKARLGRLGYKRFREHLIYDPPVLAE